MSQDTPAKDAEWQDLASDYTERRQDASATCIQLLARISLNNLSTCLAEPYAKAYVQSDYEPRYASKCR